MTTSPTFEVCQTRRTTSTVSDASTKVATKTKFKSTLEYLVKASIDGSIAQAAQVSDTQAIEAPGLPTVNGTTFFDSNSGQSRPYMMCTNKSCKRDAKNGGVFWVTAEYEEIIDGRENPGQGCPEDLTDITPKASAAVTLEPKVLYEDMSPQAVDCYRMPAVYEPYETPVTTQTSKLIVTQEQYESYITFEQMMYRIGLVNSVPYRGRAAGHWMILGMTAKEVEVTLCSGTVQAVIATYQIGLSDYTVGNYETGGGENGEPYKDIFVGWDTALPLVSRFYNDGGGKKTFADGNTGYGNVGFIMETGEPKSDDSRPNYMVYKSTRTGPFSFLQVA
jgi:hypothetical protein